MGLVSIAADLGMDVSLTVLDDSSAAIGICRRRGLGKIRHLAVSDLWVQQRCREKGVELDKIQGDTNESDMMTKPIDGRRLRKLLQLLGVQIAHDHVGDDDQGDND